MSARKASQQLLERQLNALENATVDGVLTFNQVGQIRSCSEVAAELFGYHVEDLIGASVAKLMPPDEADLERASLAKTGHTSLLRVLDRTRSVRGRRIDGNFFPFRLTVKQVGTQEDGYLLGVVHDLSEYERSRGRILKLHQQLQRTNETLEASVSIRTKELEKTVKDLALANKRLAVEVKEREEIAKSLAKRELQLERLLSKERELSDLRSRFVNMASHEFRTPLMTMLSSAELIEMSISNPPEVLNKHTRRIKESIGYLRNVLEDFLQLGKLDVKGADLQIRQVDLPAFISELVDELALMGKPGQDVELTFDGKLGVAQFSANGLRIILTNLITNAIKYSGEGSAIDVNIKRLNAKAWIIEVIDEGIGIPESEQTYLFERFYRASNAETIKGTGLGLHIVARYTHAMGGSIDVTARPTKGTCFTITLPYGL